MPRRPKIDALPQEARQWLERTLLDPSKPGYVALATMLKERGFEISHAAVHRFDQRLQKSMARMQATAEAARIMAQAYPDDADQQTAAVIRMVQSGLFEAMLKLDEAVDVEPAERVKLLSQAAQAIAQAGRASITQKRWQDEIRARLDALEREQGKGERRLDAETLRRVREALYG